MSSVCCSLHKCSILRRPKVSAETTTNRTLLENAWYEHHSYNYSHMVAHVTCCWRAVRLWRSDSTFYFYFIFPITFQSPYAPLPPTITTLLSMTISTFSFLVNPSTPYPPYPSCHPALHLWVCPILLVSSVCSLYSTYKWNHMLFVFFRLAYFT